MKTIGQTLKAKRKILNKSYSDLEKETRIKISFIKSIEMCAWENLPEYAVVVGFVKRIARALDIDEDKSIALLRRDYPPQTESIHPKPDVNTDKFKWSPKLTFVLGVIFSLFFILLYLGTQYRNSIRPPSLEVSSPRNEQTIEGNKLIVTGVTDPLATIKANNQSALVDENGNFATEIEISNETREIVIISTSRNGKETTEVRSIKVLMPK